MWPRDIPPECFLEGEERQKFKKIGSLILGTGLQNPSQQTEAEKRVYSRVWQIKIDKSNRYQRDRKEAEIKLKNALRMDYETMFLKTAEKNDDNDNLSESQSKSEKYKKPKEIEFNGDE